MKLFKFLCLLQYYNKKFLCVLDLFVCFFTYQFLSFLYKIIMFKLLKKFIFY
ncbi:hypothetical protein NUSPORA_01694 [Nucleospora cyclopteri]